MPSIFFPFHLQFSHFSKPLSYQNVLAFSFLLYFKRGFSCLYIYSVTSRLLL